MWSFVRKGKKLKNKEIVWNIKNEVVRNKFIEELFDNIFRRRKIVEEGKADIKY